MIHDILILLTTAGVCLHAVLGCCVHHAHDKQLQTSQVVAALTNLGCHCHQHRHSQPTERQQNHRHDDDRHNNSDRPGGQHQACCESDCSLFSNPRTNILNQVMTQMAWLPIFSHVDFSSLQRLILGRHAVMNLFSGNLEPSHSLRQLTQVWQI